MTMSRRIRNGLVSFLTVATSVLMFGGVVAPDMADASVGFVTRWPATPQIVTTSSSGSAKVYPGTDTNRLLLVAVACEYTAATAGTQTMTVTFGGVTLTPALTTNTTGASTIWLGYLNEAQIAAATSNFLTVSQSHTARTLTAMYATAAVFSGVNQSLPTAQSTSTAGATTMTISGLATTALPGNTGLAVFVANWNGQSSTPSAGYREMTDYAGTDFNLATSFQEWITSSQSFTSTAAASTAGAMAGIVLNPATNVSTIGTCGVCHGNPPFDGLGRNRIQGTYSGSHSKHSGFGYGEAGLVCTKCHYNNTTNNHQDGFKNITGSALPGNAYSLGKKIAVSNATGSGTCYTAYCHSNGRATVANRKYVPAASTRWAGPVTNCRSCHGGRASAFGGYSASKSGFKLSTTHSQHLGKYPAANINCQMCHSMTNITDAWTLRPYSSQARHANGVPDVTFTDIAYGGYTSYKSNKTCGNVSCHGGTTRNGWSETTVNNNNTCVHCHGVASYAGAGNTTANRKNFAPGWGGTGTSTDGNSASTDVRVGAHFVHLSSVHMAKLKCTECHTVPDTPFSGTHMALPRYNSQTLTFVQATSAKFNGIAFPSYTSGTAVKAATCSTVYCHGAKMRNGDTSGSYRKPSWNLDYLTGNAPDTTTCGRCHGAPPIFGTTSAVHGPATLSGTTPCSQCHTSVVTNTGVIKNKALHINGKLEAPGSPCNSCHSAKSNDTYFAANSAHKLHIYTSMKWADYQDATETNLALRSSAAAVADTYKFKCGVCHNSDATRLTYATHMNGNVSPNQSTQIYFGYYTTVGKTTGYVAGGSLAGTDTKGTGKTWTAGNGASCATTYCHSNGQEGASFVSGSNVLWSTTSRTATPARCTLCHGGARGSINPMNSGKHNRHMNNWTTMGISLFTCTACHAGTVSNNTTILPTTLRHVNKQKNYSGIYAGDNYDPATKTCTNFYCHSDSKGRFVNPGTWTTGQGPKNCDGCHGRSADGSQSASNGIGYPNYTSTAKGTFRANSHRKHITQLGITDTRGCAKCHASTADRNFANRQHPLSSNHLNGNTSSDLKPDRTAGISFSYQTATKTCNNASCHKSGRIDKSLFANVQWGDTGTCRMCHGNRNSAFGGYSYSRSNFNLSTSHKAHLKYPAGDINCQTCHYKTAADAATFKQYTGALYHNNNKRNVYLAPTYGSYSAFKSISSSNLPIPATNTKNCSNTSCHGGVTRNSWQKNTYNGDNTCVHCHGSAGTSAALPNTKANRNNFAPGWKGTGVSTDGNSSSANIRVGSHFKHLSSAYMKKLTCNECHTVPDTPFSNTKHIGAQRFNSQTLNFDQASSATVVIGVGSASTPTMIAPGSFTGYTSGTAIKAATCSSVYCHGNRLKTGETTGTYRKPYWNYSAMINYTAPATACGRCHGAPPTTGTATTDHVGATLSTCRDCHSHVNAAGSGFVNKALHINGKVESGGSCVICHANAKTRTVGLAAGQTLAAVQTEFGLAWGHKKTGRGAVTDADCIVCHLEGDFTAQAPSATYHKNGTIDLRDPDVQGETPITNIAGGAFTFRRFSTSFAAASRTTSVTETIPNIISQKFCLKCHDANGATNTTARAGVTPSANAPFGGGFTAMNNAAEFALTNSSRHPVLGPLTKDFPTPSRMSAPYNSFTRAGTSGTKTAGVVINCFDCHNTPTTPLTRRTVSAHGNTNTIRGTIGVVTPTLCSTCHLGYNTQTTVGHNSATGFTSGSAFSSTASRMTSEQDDCNNCHADILLPVRPARATNVHGTSTLPAGTAVKTGRWLAGGANGVPVAFIRNTENLGNHQPKSVNGANFTVGCDMANCRSTTGVSPYTPGGTY